MTWTGWAAWALVVVLVLMPPKYDPTAWLRWWWKRRQ